MGKRYAHPSPPIEAFEPGGRPANMLIRGTRRNAPRRRRAIVANRDGFGARFGFVFAGAIVFVVDGNIIYEMMGHGIQFRFGGLSGADGHFAVKLPRIGGDYFCLVLQGQFYG